MNILFLPNEFAYVQFHLVIIFSLLISKLFYQPMKFISLKKYFRIFPVVIFFIIWDFLVTDIWWHFNPEYVLGLNSFIPLVIPIEEILFFFVVPFALLTFIENLRNVKYFQVRYSLVTLNYFLFVLKALLGLVATMSFIYGMWYTFTISVLLLVSDFNYLKFFWVQVSFYFLLLTTFIFNYYLTYLPIVLYTQNYKSNILIGTIPVEDFGYSVILFLWIVRTVYADKKT